MNTLHTSEGKHSLIRTLRYAVPLTAVLLTGCVGETDESSSDTTLATAASIGTIPADGILVDNPPGVSLEFVPAPTEQDTGFLVGGCDGALGPMQFDRSLSDLDPTDIETTAATIGAVDKETYDAAPQGTMVPARIGATVMGIGNYSYAFVVSNDPEATVHAVNLRSYPLPEGGFLPFSLTIPGDTNDNFDVQVILQLNPEATQTDFSVVCLPYAGAEQATEPTYDA